MSHIPLRTTLHPETKKQTPFRAKSKVLNASGSTYASDVYSFGIVAWEVLSRELPWERMPRPQDVIIRVLNGLRPEIPAGAPADMASMVRSCWAGKAEDRPTFSSIMERIGSNGWIER